MWVGVPGVAVNTELCVCVPGDSVPSELLQAVNNETMKINKIYLRMMYQVPPAC